MLCISSFTCIALNISLLVPFKVFWYLNVAFIFTTIPFCIYYQRHFKENQCNHCTTNLVEREGTACRPRSLCNVQKTLLHTVELNKIHEIIQFSNKLCTNRPRCMEMNYNVRSKIITWFKTKINTLIFGTTSFVFQLSLKYRFITRIYHARTTTTPHFIYGCWIHKCYASVACFAWRSVTPNICDAIHHDISAEHYTDLLDASYLSDF